MDSAGAPRQSLPGPHLNLPVLEDAGDAAVEASPREHGSDGVGQVQHGPHHRHHVLGGTQGTSEAPAKENWHTPLPVGTGSSQNLRQEKGVGTRAPLPPASRTGASGQHPGSGGTKHRSLSGRAWRS